MKIIIINILFHIILYLYYIVEYTNLFKCFNQKIFRIGGKSILFRTQEYNKIIIILILELYYISYTCHTISFWFLFHSNDFICFYIVRFACLAFLHVLYWFLNVWKIIFKKHENLQKFQDALLAFMYLYIRITFMYCSH